jgi:outer membrane biosynthesis protein TonB
MNRFCALLLAVVLTPVGIEANSEKTTVLTTSSTPKKKSTASASTSEELDISKLPFDAESIRQVVMHHMPEIQKCYEEVLSTTGKKLEGRVTMAFNIDSNGNVTEAKAVLKKSSLKDEQVIDCILAMRRWYFPKPNDNRDHPIVYPFDLKIRQ